MEIDMRIEINISLRQSLNKKIQWPEPPERTASLCIYTSTSFCRYNFTELLKPSIILSPV